MNQQYTRICPICKEVVYHSSPDSLWHSNGVRCRKCSDKNGDRVNIGNKNGKWKGYNNLSMSYFNQIKRHSIKRGRECSITIDDVWNQFNKQNGKCVYTGIDLELPQRSRRKSNGNSSLDRIDSSRGYTKDNIQWVHKDINWMKQDFDQLYFIEMCDQVSKHSVVDNVVTPIDIFIKDNRV